MAENRVTLSLTDDQIGFLKKEAERTGLSMADVVRRSITKNQFLINLKGEGAQLAVEQKDGKLRSIEFLD